MRRPVHLAPAFSDPQPIQGEALQYRKGLTASIKNNPALVQQPFHSLLLGDEDLKHHTLQLKDFIYCKTYLQKNSSTLLERTLSGTANQSLCQQTLRNRLLDSHDSPCATKLEKALNQKREM